MRVMHLFIVLALSLFPTTFLFAETVEDREDRLCNVDILSKSVQTASFQLQDMKQIYASSFKEHLKKLKKIKGWSDDEFIEKARPLIQNDKISAFNTENQKIVASIAELNPSSQNTRPDCAMLVRLNKRLRKIIENTQSKWDFMLLRIKEAARDHY